MDLAAVITGFVVVTTAIFGFSQYFYTRITDKNTNLSTKLDDATNILKNFPLKDNSDKASNLFYQFHADEIEDKKQELDYLRHEVEQNKKKKTLISIIYRLAPFYVLYLMFYSLELFIHLEFIQSEIYTPIIKSIIAGTLGIISITLSILIIIILSLVKKINTRQKEIKEEVKDISNRLKELVNQWNALRDVVIGEISTDNSQNLKNQEQNSNRKIEKKENFMKTIGNYNLSEEQLDKMMEILSKK